MPCGYTHHPAAGVLGSAGQQPAVRRAAGVNDRAAAAGLHAGTDAVQAVQRLLQPGGVPVAGQVQQQDGAEGIPRRRLAAVPAAGDR